VSPSASQAEFVPAPWHLTGRGYVFVYRFDPDFARLQGMIEPRLLPHFRGGFGTLMLVDYASSDCGPYHELLFIPGRIQFQGRTSYSISRIFVSSISSVINGRRNWGIPKDQAEFQVDHEADGSELWRVRFRGIEIFQARIQKGRIPFPVHSALAPHTVMQSWENHIYTTKLSARGRGHVARIRDIKGDSQYFPDLSGQKPLLGIAIENIRMTFHVPRVEAERQPAFSPIR
jgi:hypothetical protein